MSEESDLIFNKLLDGQKLQSALSSTIRNTFYINGKTMDQWRNYFKLEIPATNLNPETCRTIVARIAQLYQEASFYHSLASTELQFIERGSESQYRNKYDTLVTEWKNKEGGKLPSAATLDNLAKAGLDNIYSAISTSSIVKNFWKEILDDLDTCRKLIENATFNNHIESSLNKLTT